MDTYAAGPGRRARRPGRAQQRGIDLTIALGVFALTLVLLSNLREEGDQALDALGVVLGGLAALPLVFRRRFPLGVFVLTASASAVLNALGYPPGPPFGPTLALFFLGLIRPRPWGADGSRRPSWFFSTHSTSPGSPSARTAMPRWSSRSSGSSCGAAPG